MLSSLKCTNFKQKSVIRVVTKTEQYASNIPP